MWIKTEYGRLVNVDHLYSLRVVVSEAGHWVQGRLVSAHTEPVDLTRPRPEPEARQGLDLVAEAIAARKPFFAMPQTPALPPAGR